MIKIYNRKLNKEILIDESLPEVFFEPKDWEENNPHVSIKLKGFDFFRHTKTCEDCKALLDAFNTTTVDWKIDYMGKTKRLNLKIVGTDYYSNQVGFANSEFWYGSRLKLNIDTDTKESLEIKLKEEEHRENYEGCKIIFDKINSIEE